MFHLGREDAGGDTAHMKHNGINKRVMCDTHLAPILAPRNGIPSEFRSLAHKGPESEGLTIKNEGRPTYHV